MKKLLLILLVLFSFVEDTKSQDYETIVYKDWVLSTNGTNDESFYWAITRSQISYKGHYIYDLWFYSNTYSYNYNTGIYDWNFTYVNNIYVLVNGEYVTKIPSWVSFKDKFTYDGLRFYHTSLTPNVNLIYDKPIMP